MDSLEEDRKMYWIAKTERAYLQVLANESYSQLTNKDHVIESQENILQQSHSGHWPVDGPPERCDALVPAADFISATVAAVISQCRELRCADLVVTGASAASASLRHAPTSQQGGEDSRRGVGGGGRVSLAATQTDGDQLVEQVTQLTAERDDQAQVLRQQTDLLERLRDQLTHTAAENERLQRHLQLVNALFEQLQRKEAEGAAAADGHCGADDADETDDAGTAAAAAAEDLVERVDTPHGRRMVIHVSRTYLRLRDLILEKRSLLSEIDKLRGFNHQLERRLSKQERRLSSVASELHSTWGLVTKLKIQHAQLHTAESVLRYELREKRKLLSRLRGELEGSRQRSALASQLNAESEQEWRALRRELDQRKRELLVRQPRVDESEGGGAERSDTEAGERETNESGPAELALLERGSTFESQNEEEVAEVDGATAETVENSVAESVESESTESESAGVRTPEPRAAGDGAGASADATPEPPAVPPGRLVSLEDQCQQLYTRLVSTTARQVALSSRLAELHAQHGASEAETTSVASSEDTAYASLELTRSPSETEAGEPPADRSAGEALQVTPQPLTARAAVAAEPTAPVAVAALRVAVQADGGPHALPPLPATQLATETAHRPGGDHALVAAVVTVTEPATGAGQLPTVAAETLAADEEEQGELEDAAGAVGGAAAVCEDDVSRSTADLLDEVSRFLNRTRPSSSTTTTPPPPPPPPSVPEPELLSDSDENDEADQSDRPGVTSAGCKLISLLPSRMVYLRQEREQLTQHIAQLQQQNERIEQKLARMRSERREQRRRGREDSTAKEHLERRVQELERELRLQLAERYAVPSQTEQPPQYPSTSPAPEMNADCEPPSSPSPESEPPTSPSPRSEPSTIPSPPSEPPCRLSLESEPPTSLSPPSEPPGRPSPESEPPARPSPESEPPTSPSPGSDLANNLNPVCEPPTSLSPGCDPADSPSPNCDPANSPSSDHESSATSKPACEPLTSPSPVSEPFTIPSPDTEPSASVKADSAPPGRTALSPGPPESLWSPDACSREVHVCSEPSGSPEPPAALQWPEICCPDRQGSSCQPVLPDTCQLSVDAGTLQAGDVSLVSENQSDLTDHSTPNNIACRNRSLRSRCHQDGAAAAVGGASITTSSAVAEAGDVTSAAHIADPEVLPGPASDVRDAGQTGVHTRHTESPSPDRAQMAVTSQSVVPSAAESPSADRAQTAATSQSGVPSAAESPSADRAQTAATSQSVVPSAAESPSAAPSGAASSSAVSAQPLTTDVGCPLSRSVGGGPAPSAGDVAEAAVPPLTQLHRQLADARGQLRSVQADCRRATQTLQQMRAPQEHAPGASITCDAETGADMASPSGMPDRTSSMICPCRRPRVSYIEFRRCLSDRLHNRPLPRSADRRKVGTLFKRRVRCHMCQVVLRLLMGRYTCRVCDELFCKRCACLVVHLPTGGKRLCVHCFYDLSASIPPSHAASNWGVPDSQLSTGGPSAESPTTVPSESAPDRTEDGAPANTLQLSAAAASETAAPARDKPPAATPPARGQR